MTKLLVSIPAYNEAEHIADVIRGATTILSETLDISADVLVVDDGSTDDTSEKASSLGAQVIRHAQNQGLGIAFRHAVAYAISHRYDVLLTIDADGQFSPDDIPSLVAPVLSDTADLVTGSRFLPASSVLGIPRAKRWGNRVVTRLVNSITKSELSDASCGFRAYNREALLHLQLFGAFTYTHEALLNLATKGLRIAEAPISVTYSRARRSRLASSLLRYGYRTGTLIFKSTVAYQPYRLFGTLALLLWAVAIPVTLVLGGRYLMTDLITPYKGIAITALIMLGLGFTSFAAGTLLEVLRRMQLSVEEILYYERRRD